MSRGWRAARMLAILVVVAASSTVAWAAEHPAGPHPAGPQSGGSDPAAPQPAGSQPAALQPAALRLQVDVVQGNPHDTVNLSARLLQADGKPIGSRSVAFFVRTAIFGTRLLPLGAPNTDSTGTATVTYTPTWEGEQQFVVRFAGDATYAKAETIATALVRVATQAYRAEEEPLMAARVWLPVAVGAIVVGVWGILISLLLAAVRGLPLQLKEAAPDQSSAGRVGYRPAPYRTERITQRRWHA